MLLYYEPQADADRLHDIFIDAADTVEMFWRDITQTKVDAHELRALAVSVKHRDKRKKAMAISPHALELLCIAELCKALNKNRRPTDGL